VSPPDMKNKKKNTYSIRGWRAWACMGVRACVCCHCVEGGGGTGCHRQTSDMKNKKKKKHTSFEGGGHDHSEQGNQRGMIGRYSILVL